MDPDANWIEQESGRADHDRMFDLIEALHLWIERGGFKPNAWQNDPTAEARFDQRVHNFLGWT